MILEKAYEQLKLSREQVAQCDQMKVSIERFFNSLNDLLDETNYILTDWSTPLIELGSQCKTRVYQRCLEVERHQLTYCMTEQFVYFKNNQFLYLRVIRQTT